MDVNKALKDIGLTENEIKVYITLLKIGPSIVSQIAERSGLYRPYVYDTLERLQEKGLVSSTIKDNKKSFQAADPSQLIEIEKIKLGELNKILPILGGFLKSPKEETKAELYSGKKVIRVIQKDILKNLSEKGGESLVIGVDERKYMETDPIILEQFFIQMKKNKFKERVLVREGDNYLPAPKETTKYKFLPKEFFDPTSTFIYGNTVAIIIFGEPLYGLIIRSKILSQTYKKQFNLLWKVAKIKP
ncbi:sugar-specific transcriptional regulator TrmB [archaeon BMS3Abin17]|nr:sugar-specific transcriptional regulator TrmB [archaeon BMS3Abin17]